ncbi:MAG: acyl carrier protein [Planctomycetes bacterium]|nr:acyl carrier protein [Planctomycetota bacterium]MBI3843467.1 acyl carrier protein [Planctomycetota bacterium]
MNIEDTIMRFIHEKLVSGPRPDVTATTDLVGSGMLDSTAMMELVVWIEEHFSFQVAVDDLVPENFGSVRNLRAYVEKNLNGRMAQP